MMGEHVVETLDPELELGIVAETEQDDTPVRAALPDDQVAEVVIAGDQNTVLANREREYVLVWQPCLIVAGDARGVIPLRPKVRLYPSISALVEEKSHADAACDSPCAGPRPRRR